MASSEHVVIHSENLQSQHGRPRLWGIESASSRWKFPQQQQIQPSRQPDVRCRRSTQPCMFVCCSYQSCFASSFMPPWRSNRSRRFRRADRTFPPRIHDEDAPTARSRQRLECEFLAFSAQKTRGFRAA